MDYSSNNHLQEVCNVKQPVLFEYKSVSPEFADKITYDELSSNNYDNVDIKVKDINDYWETDDSIDYIVLPYPNGIQLMTTDDKSKYFTENNEDFLEDSGLIKVLQTNDTNIKPNFTAISKYDICSGSKNTITPLRYHTNSRFFIYVNSGKLHIKMTPWKSTKYLYKNKDFENYEFRSPINVWKPQKKYMHEMEKIKFLDFEVSEGYMLFVPSYWWYSIKYTSEGNTMFSTFTYNSIMNCLANTSDIAKYYLQQNNIKTRIAKTLDIQKTVVANELEETAVVENEEASTEPIIKKIHEIVL
jgi:hypothetical protein